MSLIIYVLMLIDVELKRNTNAKFDVTENVSEIWNMKYIIIVYAIAYGVYV